MSMVNKQKRGAKLLQPDNPVAKRKAQRKEKRLLKKAKRHAFSLGKKIPTVSPKEADRLAAVLKEKKKEKNKAKRARSLQRKIEAQKARHMAEKEKIDEEKKVKLAISQEDREILDLEKKLRVKKTSARLPQSFATDGLDYLLEPLDSYKEGEGDMMLDTLNGDVDDVDNADTDSESDENLSLSEEESETEYEEITNKIEVVSSSTDNIKSILKDKSLTDKPDVHVKFAKEASDDSLSKTSVKTSDKLTKLKLSNKPDSIVTINVVASKKIKRKTESSDASCLPHKVARKVHSDDEDDFNDVMSDDDSDKVDDSDEDVTVQAAKYVPPGKRALLAKGSNKLQSASATVRSNTRKVNKADVSDDVGNFDESDSGDDDDKDDVVSDEDDATVREDIYGRTIDKFGKVVKEPASAYVPPGKRELLENDSGKRKFVRERIKKQLKGLINRTSEANMQPISNQIESIFQSNTRGDVSEILTELLLGACITSVLTPERLCQELMMLVAILHGNIGMEIGAYFLQCTANKFEALFKKCKNSESKEMDNVVLLIASLFNFRVIGSRVLLDVANRFIKRFCEKDIELILLLLKSAGFGLRKDNPEGLRTLILEIQTVASSVDTSRFKDPTRMRFMLETLLAIKNNNMRKIPNYDPEHLEHLRKLIRSYVRQSGFGSNQLNISLEDLQKSENKGRWWMVGSAWGGPTQTSSAMALQSTSAVTPCPSILNKASSDLVELARVQRMNTDIRKTIFYVIMTSEDYVDAFEKLLKLGFNHTQEREIIHVIIDCCLQEKSHNPFYSVLALKFCVFDRRFQMTFQFTLWDKFKEMDAMSSHNRENLSRILSFLMLKKGLSLSVLKVVEFGTLKTSMVRFLKTLMTLILLAEDDSEMEAVFERIAPLEKLRHLHDGLKLFLRHFLLKGKLGLNSDDASELTLRVRVAERALSSSNSNVLF